MFSQFVCDDFRYVRGISSTTLGGWASFCLCMKRTLTSTTTTTSHYTLTSAHTHAHTQLYSALCVCFSFLKCVLVVIIDCFSVCLSPFSIPILSFVSSSASSSASSPFTLWSAFNSTGLVISCSVLIFRPLLLFVILILNSCPFSISFATKAPFSVFGIQIIFFSISIHFFSKSFKCSKQLITSLFILQLTLPSSLFAFHSDLTSIQTHLIELRNRLFTFQLSNVFVFSLIFHCAVHQRTVCGADRLGISKAHTRLFPFIVATRHTHTFSSVLFLFLVSLCDTHPFALPLGSGLLLLFLNGLFNCPLIIKEINKIASLVICKSSSFTRRRKNRCDDPFGPALLFVVSF